MTRLKYFLRPWLREDADKVSEARQAENVAQVAAKDLKRGSMALTGMVAVGLMLGAAIGAYLFFGLLMLAGIVALVESTPPVRWLVERSNKLVDWAIFGVTMWGAFYMGITAMEGWTVAGLGYTLVYGPFLRMRFNQNKLKKAA